MFTTNIKGSEDLDLWQLLPQAAFTITNCYRTKIVRAWSSREPLMCLPDAFYKHNSARPMQLPDYTQGRNVNHCWAIARLLTKLLRTICQNVNCDYPEEACLTPPNSILNGSFEQNVLVCGTLWNFNDWFVSHGSPNQSAFASNGNSGLFLWGEAVGGEGLYTCFDFEVNKDSVKGTMVLAHPAQEVTGARATQIISGLLLKEVSASPRSEANLSRSEAAELVYQNMPNFAGGSRNQ